MCNCGKKRTEHNQQTNVAVSHGKKSMPPAQQSANNVFEYIGKTALTVIGNITGRRYRFNRPGDLQSVDPRDAGGMTAVPVLRRR